ncbi:MAG: hypothetical protein J0I41_02345 [Filimonas sp.]|nr:hypothetical protein [Filimonas sp.]
MYRKIISCAIVATILIVTDVNAQLKHSATSAFPSYKGLVMAGYQGWFNAPDDGAGRGWNHYHNGKKFEPGNCKFDLWPDMTEYKKTYATPFKYADSSTAYLFSSYDKSTVDLHFKWMKEYGVDGAFVQRFVSTVRSGTSLKHNNTVLAHALDAAKKYHRAIAVMYDFSGMRDSTDVPLIINDWKNLVDSLHLTTGGKHQPYLYHNNKPLVALWGVGFAGRKYTSRSIRRIMDFLQYDPVYGGCAILLGVPTGWREQKGDAGSDTAFVGLLKSADIIQPWFVGRFNANNINDQPKRIAADLAWCKANNVDYVPVVYPGFSWHNMYPTNPTDQIPRNRGTFYWQQIAGAINAGVGMLYVAMFDEIDEGTAIFKVSTNPPVGASPFVKFETGIPSDYYLYLTGKAGAMLRKQEPLSLQVPLPPTISNKN